MSLKNKTCLNICCFCVASHQDKTAHMLILSISLFQIVLSLFIFKIWYLKFHILAKPLNWVYLFWKTEVAEHVSMVTWLISQWSFLVFVLFFSFQKLWILKMERRNLYLVPLFILTCFWTAIIAVTSVQMALCHFYWVCLFSMFCFLFHYHFKFFAF